MNLPFFELVKNPSKKTAILYLNRPDKRNAMNWPFWRDLPQAVDEIEKEKDIRVVVIAGKGKSFSTGLDIEEFFTQFKEDLTGDVADRREKLYKLILTMQEGMNRISASSKIFISAVHKHCIGGALDLISACDIRYCTEDAQISLREAKVAIVADMGSLNRLPSIIGQGNTRLLALTGGDFDGQTALRMGLVSEVFDSQEKMMKKAEEVAEEIAANPSIAVRGTKHILNYMQNHSVEDGLKYVAAWNSAFLDSLDLREIGSAFKERRKPKFQD